ncbi:MAG TPA: adenosylcobinamide-phosphate synthase CbiB [Candidatus Udaeobacter sp.]|nr:adenosylcobinamide-phosphate synthase CbiB [Candidatus Udaeobacter sp.]
MVSAFLLDLAIGDPLWLPHPVVLMGKAISWGEKLIWSGAPRRDFLAGMALTFVVVVLSAGIARAMVLLFSLLPAAWAFMAAAFLASTTIATRGLLIAVARIERPLRDGDIVQARAQLSRIVGRETQNLNQDKVLRAGLESLAESTCDGIVAPLFYLFLGGIPLAMAYKAANTLDSMIGYRIGRYLYFGKFAARLDDVFNFIPARLTALVMVAAASLLKLKAPLAAKVLWRDHANHLSPNAGYPEAALAGAFGIRLGGPSIYFGKQIAKPYIGEEVTPAKIEMLKEARTLCLVTAILSLMIFVLISPARS